jgi:WD40 repeat protein
MMSGVLPAKAVLATLLCAAGSVAAAQPTAAGVESEMRVMRADHMVLDVAVHRSTLLAATQSGQAVRYDWRTGERGAVLFDLERDAKREIAPSVSSIAISPSGHLYAAVSTEGTLRMGQLDGSLGSDSISTYERAGLLIVRFVDEDRLLLGDMRGQISLFDIEQKREVYTRQLEYDPVFALVIGPERRRVAVAFRSSRIHVVEVEEGESQRVLRGHRDSVYALAWLGSMRLASGSKDKSLLIWDLSTSSTQPRLLYSGDHYIEAMAISQRGDVLAFTLEENTLGLLHLEDGKIIRRLSEHTAPVRALLFTDHDRHLISAGSDARIVAWNLLSGSEPGGPDVLEGRVQ